MAPQPTDLARLAALLGARPRSQRSLVALVGAPGSGKSHVAEALADRINVASEGRAAVLPMDGYHFDDALLKALGRHARKGAPDTFDVGGLAHMLGRLRTPGEGEIAVPVFDRDLEISRAGARLIAPRSDIVIVEGNYLLLDTGPWARLAGAFDLTVFLDVPEATLRQRLTARWQGYRLSEAEIARKLDEVDLPNGRFVAAHSRPADFTLAN